MAKIFYIPYAKYALDSDLSKEEVLIKLKDHIIKPKLFNYMSWKKSNLFVGSIDSNSGHFKIKKQTMNRNSFNPYFYGTIRNNGQGSRISVVLRLPTVLYVFMILFLIGWLSIGLLQVEQAEDLFMPIGGLVFIYALSFFGFNLGAGAALDSLYAIV